MKQLAILAHVAVLFTASIATAEFTKLPAQSKTFQVGEHEAFVMAPAKKADGHPWVWYAPTLEFIPDSSHKFYFDQFLANGIAVAGYNQGDVRGSDKASAKFTLFYDAMVARGYSSKPFLLGQSRGGFMMLNWAYRNPACVGGFAGIYPVCNMTSWPLKNVKQSVLAEYGLSEAEILQNLDKLNPPENLKQLAKNNVPFYLVYGDNDVVVPHNENSLVIKENYEKLGGSVEVKLVPSGGHTGGPFYFNEQSLADFIIGHALGN